MAEKTMNKQDLIAELSGQADLPRVKTAEVVDAMFRVIETALKAGKEVKLVGFGSFVATTRKATKGRNPRTGEEIDIPASSTVRFKPGKGLKDAVS